jgi:hypothetical protein
MAYSFEENKAKAAEIIDEIIFTNVMERIESEIANGSLTEISAEDFARFKKVLEVFNRHGIHSRRAFDIMVDIIEEAGGADILNKIVFGKKKRTDEKTEKPDKAHFKTAEDNSFVFTHPITGRRIKYEGGKLYEYYGEYGGWICSDDLERG